jgi:dUTPase
MILNVLKNGSENLLNPSNPGDAGFDLISKSPPKIKGELYMEGLYKNISYIEYDTGVSIAPELDEYNDCDFFSLVYPRSSISNYNLLLCNSVGVIDCGYRGTIKVRFKYIAQPENFYFLKEGNALIGIDKSKIYKKGDKIAQLVFSQFNKPRLFIKNNLDSSTRSSGGFGSTGL